MKWRVWILFGLLSVLIAGYPVRAETEPNPEQGLDRPLDIMLVLDNSKTMRKNDPTFLTKKVIMSFVDQMQKRWRLGMVLFDDKARLIEQLTVLSYPEAKRTFVKGLQFLNYSGRYSNIPAGIERAVYELKYSGRTYAEKFLIFLTDGSVDIGDDHQNAERTEWLETRLLDEAIRNDIKMIGIGYTEYADIRLIRTLAQKSGGAYFQADQLEDIVKIFLQIIEVVSGADSVTDDANRLEAAEKTKASDDMSSSSAEKDSPKSIDKVMEKIPLSGYFDHFPIRYAVLGALSVLAVIMVIMILLRIFRPGQKDQTDFPAASREEPEIPPSVSEYVPEARLVDYKSVVSKSPILLNKRIIEIGRDKIRDISISKKTISSLHATIEYQDGYYYVEDQRSTNGTILNGKKLQPGKPVRLKSGDRIRFEAYEFGFFLPNQVPAGNTLITPGPKAESTTVPELPKSKPKPKTKQQSENIEAPDLPRATHENDETQIKPRMCPKHPGNKATDLCVNCKKAFCRHCMTEVNGKELCIDCARQISKIR